MTKKLLLGNGPNLNMLGAREPDKYGTLQLPEIVQTCESIAKESGYTLISYQSNQEGNLVDFIQQQGMDAVGMILNAGAYTHTSIAIRDAILSVKLPFIEVHLSNVYSREEFRHRSYLADIAVGVISGFRENSYYLGLRGLIHFLENKLR